MSSSYDSGYWNHQRVLEEKRKCEKSPDGKHEWLHISGGWPSIHRQCKYCRIDTYTK